MTGNLAISLIAGTLTTIVLLALGVPFAVALGVIVAILDLIPLAGATSPFPWTFLQLVRHA